MSMRAEKAQKIAHTSPSRPLTFHNSLPHSNTFARQAATILSNHPRVQWHLIILITALLSLALPLLPVKQIHSLPLFANRICSLAPCRRSRSVHGCELHPGFVIGSNAPGTSATRSTLLHLLSRRQIPETDQTRMPPSQVSWGRMKTTRLGTVALHKNGAGSPGKPRGP
eukprot:3772452-Rhodomonas_salina.1